MSIEDFPERTIQPKTIDNLLEAVDAQVGQLAPVPNGYRYEAFKGEIDQTPTDFIIYQIPIEISSSDSADFHISGRTAIIGVAPSAMSKQGYTYYSFYPTTMGMLVRKELDIKYVDSTDFYDGDGNFDAAAYKTANNQHIRETRIEEFGHGLDEVSEQEAQKLLTALHELEPDMERQAALAAIAQYDKIQSVKIDPERKQFIKKNVARVLGLLGLKSVDN